MGWKALLGRNDSYINQNCSDGAPKYTKTDRETIYAIFLSVSFFIKINLFFVCKDIFLSKF